MSYYFFDRCTENCIPGLEKIAKELGLTEYAEKMPSKKYWQGNVLESENEFDQDLIIMYDPTSHLPLMIQTNTHDPKKKQIKNIIKSLIDLCQPSEIYQEPFAKLKYDLKDFED